MPGHGLCRFAGIAGEEGIDDGEVFHCFLGDAMRIVSGFFEFPGNIAEDSKEDFKSAQFIGKKNIVAR